MLNTWFIKAGASEEDRMSMRAKTNFYASKVGEHPNILHFMGAVLDDETRKLFFLIIHFVNY